MDLSPELAQKYARLKDILNSSAPLAIAFSGGADSALLVSAAAETIAPDKLLAITARAVFFPDWEFEEAALLAKTLKITWRTVDVDILAVPKVAENPPDRCYFCKKFLFQTLMEEARGRGFSALADGGNQSDNEAFRPGMRAAAELGVISPLKAAGLIKDEISALSRYLDLPTWNKPANACLASRFPHGRRITKEELAQVESGEAVLRRLGFRQIRLRHHGETARLELAPDDFSRFLNEALIAEIRREIKALGFTFVTLDLAPYRQYRQAQGFVDK